MPRNHGPTITYLVALSSTGMPVPRVFARAVTSDRLVRWVLKWLVPTSVHRNSKVRSAIEAAGRSLRYLPAFSSDFNPIEFAFANLETHLRGVTARSFAPC